MLRRRKPTAWTFSFHAFSPERVPASAYRKTIEEIQGFPDPRDQQSTKRHRPPRNYSGIFQFPLLITQTPPRLSPARSSPESLVPPCSQICNHRTHSNPFPNSERCKGFQELGSRSCLRCRRTRNLLCWKPGFLCLSEFGKRGRCQLNAGSFRTRSNSELKPANDIISFIFFFFFFWIFKKFKNLYIVNLNFFEVFLFILAQFPL